MKQVTIIVIIALITILMISTVNNSKAIANNTKAMNNLQSSVSNIVQVQNNTYSNIDNFAIVSIARDSFFIFALRTEMGEKDFAKVMKKWEVESTKSQR